MTNPFTPAFGAIPLFPAGRDQILTEAESAFQNYKSNPFLTSILAGSQGRGKTSLLRLIGDEARRQGWLVIDTAARSGMLEEIYQNLLLQTSDLLDRKAKKLTSVQIGNIGFSFESEKEISLNWRNRMEILLSQLAEYDTGLLIMADEVTADEPEMIELTSVYQLFKRRFEKISLFMAGLPANISYLLNEKSVTFLRRAHRIYLGRIADHDIAIAFRKSIESEGKSIPDDALSAAVKAADGFAYMMQLVGYYTWICADKKETIDLNDAEQGITYAKQELETGVLESIYRELSRTDRRFLYAMLEDARDSSLKDIAERLHKTPGYASTYKKRLLLSGVIEEHPDKTFSICMPFFREYLLEMQKNA